MVYRKISPTQAEAKLKEMEQNCPGEDANAMIGHIYMLSYNTTKSSKDEKAAYEAFKKGDISKYDKTYLNEFARASYFTNHYDDALAACEAGLKLEPRNPTFVRLCMFANYEKQEYEKAKSFINRYFNETDSAKFSEYDHYYSALIYKALDEKEKAYEEYDNALELVNDSSMIKKWDIYKAVSDCYLADANFDNAIKYYNEYLACKPSLNFDDQEGLAKLYSKYADADEARKTELMTKAVEIFRAAGEQYRIQEVYSTYMAANYMNKLDDNMKNNLAKPDYMKLIELLSNKTDRSSGENTMLKTAYHYMMFNSFINKDKATAKDYADKILAIDPEYAPALEIKNLK
jgi:tetratricopeptide (TPR) repeat protein